MPFEPGEHDSKLWVPDSARATVVKEAPPPTVVIDNQTDLPDELLESYFIENTAMFGFGQEARYMSYPSEGTMMARSKWRPPRNVIEEIAIARDYIERDDDCAATVDAILAAAYGHGYSNQHADEQVEHTFREMSEDIGLIHILHELHREFLIAGQINSVSLFVRGNYNIRPENVSRVLTRSVAAPMVGVLPAERIRVVGSDIFGEGVLGYVPEGTLAEWLREFFNARTTPAKKREMALNDPIAAALFVSKLQLPWNETDLLSSGMDLYALNPDMVHRSTRAKGSWRYPRPLLTRNLSLLEAKRLLTIMDHAYLQGGANYIVLAKKGDKDQRATNAEMQNLQALVQRASRSGVLIGDHRISLEVIQPDMKEMLEPNKRRMIGRKLSQALLRVPEFGSDETGNAVQTFTELAQLTITDDRQLVLDHVHRFIWRAVMKRNMAVFGRNDRPTIWTPRVILQGMDFWTQYLLKLYDRGDLPRKYMVEFGGYDYDAVKAQKQREVQGGHDAIFMPPAVPYSAPGQMGEGTNPFHFGNPAALPTGPGPQDNSTGRPPGSPNRNGTPADRTRPTRQIRQTRGETVRASWNEEEQLVVRIGEITERVLGEYPDAVLGRVTPSERSAIDAGQTRNEGNVIVIPVNRGIPMDDAQAVRLAENFSMLVGHRVPDGAIMAIAFCFREPSFSVHQAEDMIVRWGFPIELSAAPADALPDDGDDILNCPSCNSPNEYDAAACANCGYDGPPFTLPPEMRRQVTPHLPIALHVTVNGDTATVTPAAPAPAPQPVPPPGWTSHETELMWRSLMAEKNLWDAALELATENKSAPKTVATGLHEKIVPRAMLNQMVTNGWDPTKVDWIQIANQLIERAPHPRPKED